MSVLSALLVGAGAAAWLIAAHERRHYPRELVRRGKYLETFRRCRP